MYQDTNLSGVPSASLDGLDQMPARTVSEFERESESVAANLNSLEECLQILERRLSPVLAEPAPSAKCAGQTSPPSSPIGVQLRGYSDRIESAAWRVSHLLGLLALP
jgi:hypothetical protein